VVLWETTVAVIRTVTFGSGGRRRFCPKRNGRKELRRLQEREVLPVVLKYSPLIGTRCINLHRNRIFMG